MVNNIVFLQHQMDPSSNFYNYRTALRGAAQRSLTAHSSREKVCRGKRVLLVIDLPCFTLTWCKLLPGAVLTSSDLREVQLHPPHPWAHGEGEHRAKLALDKEK